MTAVPIRCSLDEVVAALVASGHTAKLIGEVGNHVDVTDVRIDSNQCVPGDLFACVSGRRHDGHDFALDAVAHGAVGLVVERPLDIPVPQIVVSSTREVLGVVASAVHGNPSARTLVIGITGTNGKTTVAAMVAAVLESTGQRAAVIGTLSGRLTTPEAPDLQRMINDAADRGQAVVMEVSSHALVEHRVDGIAFAVAAFTNLGRDHLDLHGSMQEYFRAKASLFTELNPASAVINVGDTHGRLLVDALNDAGASDVAGITIDDATVLHSDLSGSTFVFWGREWSIPLAGKPHIENALVAIGICRAVGLDDGAIAQGLATMPTVPGRLELVPGSVHGIDVIVDFAHTPEALEALLATCATLAPERRTVLVFGCGGDRDRSKRPEMGRVACRADRVVLTSDNPRSEDPEAIIADIRSGIQPSFESRVTSIVDRRSAIQTAIEEAQMGDLIVIAGRGHERVQEIAGHAVEFDDRAVARQYLGDAS